MQYSVPQFIDAEDKLIGPFTLKQFGFVFGGGILDVLIFRVLGHGIIFYILAVPIALAALAIAFVPFNGRMLYQVLPLFFKFLTSPKIYVFRHVPPNLDQIATMNAKINKVDAPAVVQNQAELETTQSKLKKLSSLLDQRQTEQRDILTRTYNGQQ